MIKTSRRVLRQFRIRPRLSISVLIGVFVALVLPRAWVHGDVTRVLIGWNTGVLIYLALAGLMMVRSDHAQLKRRASQEDEGAVVILGLVVIAALASLVAIVVELSVARNLGGAAKAAHIGLAGLTIVSSWAFTQVMFALHYAHDFYMARESGAPCGLLFPDTQDPDYLDFLYFSVVIGTSGQTADVSIASRPMRRVGMMHCVLAFFFNTSLLALTINVASGLL
jgi:uncharacterized membrane protein